eukprot:TRINITY_DN9539_c0_g1_i1.p1 TRINITY_DN9539_c0_g1~~TRINITY_DN9539_c0_g1_i1.p1  ORF type:complete len:146 (+),score=14.84 TRINITY_DN9539_c0_g1_i1:125-562(+)
MLNYKNSDVMEFGKSLDRLATRRRANSHSFSRTERFKEERIDRPSDNVYRLDCDFVSDARRETRGSRLTRSRTCLTYTFNTSEDRRDLGDAGGGFLRGIAPTHQHGRVRDVSLLGPGQYDSGWFNKPVSTAFSFPRARLRDCDKP